MRRFVLLPSVLLAIAQMCSAAPCAVGSLASYIALGAAGCTIGTNTLDDFATLSGIAGATPISPADIAITPSGASTNAGITASVNVTATTGEVLEALFTYQISGNLYAADSITLSHSSESADGAVSDTQNYCVGGTFGPDGVTGCSGSPGSLIALDGVQNQDSQSFSPAGLLSITDDFTLDGGLAGSASGGDITDRFTVVPEPSGFVFTALALALGLIYRLRFPSGMWFRR